MNPRILVAVCLCLAVGFATADQYDETYYEVKPYEAPPAKEGPPSEEEPASKDPEPKDPEPAEENPKPEETAVAGHDSKSGMDPVAEKFKGFCHWGVAIYYKPGFQIRCSCMKCTCQSGGKWDCAYHFAYCPYYYCGNHIYNPLTQICCCGKVYDKKSSYSCCGYYYYYTKTSKCCNYYSVKPIKSHCPRYKI